MLPLLYAVLQLQYACVTAAVRLCYSCNTLVLQLQYAEAMKIYHNSPVYQSYIQAKEKAEVAAEVEKDLERQEREEARRQGVTPNKNKQVRAAGGNNRVEELANLNYRVIQASVVVFARTRAHTEMNIKFDIFNGA